MLNDETEQLESKTQRGTIRALNQPKNKQLLINVK